MRSYTIAAAVAACLMTGPAFAGTGSAGADDVLQPLQTTQTVLDTIANLQPSSRVEVIGVEDVRKARPQAYAKAIAGRKDDIARLQAAINANADFKSQLSSANIDVNAIVGAEVESDGSLALFTAS